MRIHINEIILSAFLLSPFSAFSQIEQSKSYNFTLEQCIDYAFSNSLKRQSMKLSERSAELGLEQSKNARKPNVSGSVSESLSHNGHEESVNLGGSIGVNAGITIYQGGAINNNIEKSKLEAKKSQVSTVQYDHTLLLQILQYFMTAISSEEMMHSQQRILEMQKEQLRQGEEKYKVGTILESDYLILKAQYESDKCNVLNSQISHDNALLSLKQVLSLDPTEELVLVYPDTTDMEALALLPPIETVIERTIATNPDLQLAQYSIDIAEINKEIAKAGHRPTISASAGLHTSHRNFEDFGNQLGNSFGQSLGVSMSIPIYDRGNTKTSLKMRDVEQKMAEINKQNTELELRQTVTKECSNVNLAYAQYKAYKLKSDAYEKVFDVYSKKFEYGTITSVDLLQQQNNYVNALQDYFNSKYNFILSRKMLDVYMDYPIKYVAEE